MVSSSVCVFVCIFLHLHPPPLPPPSRLNSTGKWTSVYILCSPASFQLREAFVTKNSSHVIKSNSLFGSSYVVLAKSETAYHSIERSNGCTRGSIHISLNIMTLSKKLRWLYWIGTMLYQEKENTKQPKSIHRKFLSSLRMTFPLLKIQLKICCGILCYPATQKLTFLTKKKRNQ